MPPPTLFDLSTIDLSRIVVTREEIYERLPHRHEFMLLDGIVHLDLERPLAVGLHEVREDEWWVKGHIPGRPLMPGVLMIEAAAQLASYVCGRLIPRERFVGFGGIEETKFRESISPPAKLYIVGVGLQSTPRKFVSDTQGFVNGRMVFQSKITGLVL